MRGAAIEGKRGATSAAAWAVIGRSVARAKRGTYGVLRIPPPKLYSTSCPSRALGNSIFRLQVHVLPTVYSFHSAIGGRERDVLARHEGSTPRQASSDWPAGRRGSKQPASLSPSLPCDPRAGEWNVSCPQPHSRRRCSRLLDILVQVRYMYLTPSCERIRRMLPRLRVKSPGPRPCFGSLVQDRTSHGCLELDLCASRTRRVPRYLGKQR